MATKKAPKKPAAKAPKAKGTAKRAKAASDKPKPRSALDTAAQVLAASKEPLNAKQMIDAMAARGLWTSAGGKTPHATLYSGGELHRFEGACACGVRRWHEPLTDRHCCGTSKGDRKIARASAG